MRAPGAAPWKVWLVYGVIGGSMMVLAAFASIVMRADADLHAITRDICDLPAARAEAARAKAAEMERRLGSRQGSAL